MAVIKYSKKKDGDEKLSTNFTVKEFACKDGSDEILISQELVQVLQKIRTKFKKPVAINSGYRTSTYNRKIGGAYKSMHTQGLAADIAVKGVDPLAVAMYASKLLGKTGGVEVGSYNEGTGGYIHIDVRTTPWRSIKPSASAPYTTYTTFLPTIKYGSTGAGVTVLSRKLKKLGYMTAVKDRCDSIMYSAIKSFQSKAGLTQDGICGEKTWVAIISEL